MSSSCGKHNERVFDLAGSLFDGCASAADIRELEAALGRAENRRGYLAYALLHAQLRLTNEALQASFYVLETNRRAVVNADETSKSSHGAEKSDRISVGWQRSARFGSIRRVALATRIWLTALAVLVSVSLLGLLVTRRHSEKVGGAPVAIPVAVGSFSRSANVRWVEKAHRWSVGDALAVGQSIEFDSGRVELQFDCGALMTVVGPAALEIKSANLVALHSGTATTRIEDGNGGNFRVVTAATEVLDLGTEFGVRVRPDGQTDVVVFEGMVDLTPLAGALNKQHEPRTLSVGEAVCINRIGDWKRLVSIESDAFPFGAGIFDIERARPPLIHEVSDNLSTTSRPKFYAIVPGGFREDARSYVDRIYEWNGLDETGFPRELSGGDYIRTFNDDKLFENFELVIALARPATLYVLFDDRVPVPTWLRTEFQETSLDVGLDTGSPPGVDPGPSGRMIAIGAGRMVDYRFSVWKREFRNPSRVRLGSIRESPLQKIEGTAMYGIVAVPLDLPDNP